MSSPDNYWVWLLGNVRSDLMILCVVDILVCVSIASVMVFLWLQYQSQCADNERPASFKVKAYLFGLRPWIVRLAIMAAVLMVIYSLIPGHAALLRMFGSHHP